VAHRILRGIDFFVLWSSLGVGLLVLVAGSLLVPGLGLFEALLISLAGSLIGSMMLASAGFVGSRYGCPDDGLPQAHPRHQGVISANGAKCCPACRLDGLRANDHGAGGIKHLGPISWRVYSYLLGSCVCGLVCRPSNRGPLAFVRKWLERVAIWLVYFSAIWITIQVFSSPKVWEVLARPGDGSLPILLALDLVIAMPISWWPLISDYNRFSSTVRGDLLEHS
jgi:hypothetical protein